MRKLQAPSGGLLAKIIEYAIQESGGILASCDVQAKLRWENSGLWRQDNYPKYGEAAFAISPKMATVLDELLYEDNSTTR